MIVRFHVLSPPAKQRSFAARLPLLLGRGEEANFRIQHDLVSRRHCEFFARDGRVFIHDLGSTNGTFLDDEQVPVSTKTEVPPGGVVRVGGLSFRVDYQPAAGGVVPNSPARSAGGDRVEDDQDAEQSRVAGGNEAAEELPPDFDFVAPENAETEPLATAARTPAREPAAAPPFMPPEPTAADAPPADRAAEDFVVPDHDPPAVAPWAALEGPQADAAAAGADADDDDDGPDDDKFNEFLKGLK